MPANSLRLTRPRLKRLFENLGQSDPERRDKLKAILNRFYQKASQDLLIGFFFKKKDLSHIAKMQGRFLLKAMGVNQTYSGKLPQNAHRKLPSILPGHFDRRIKILEETLSEFAISAEDIRTWLTFERSFRKSIVKRTSPQGSKRGLLSSRSERT